jgi:hypothetical protein
MTRVRVRLVILVGLTLAVGFLVGTWRAGVMTTSGRADSTGNGGGSISTDGWTYGFPADVAWTDTTNRFHPDGLPDCLPPLSSVEGLRFAWVGVSVEGLGWRQVVWIDCRSVPQPSAAPTNQ